MSFEEYFGNESYVKLKNSLFNYLLRKSSIRKQLGSQPCGLILDIGSGISPVSEQKNSTVYADVSFNALRRIDARMKVVADAENMCFKRAFDCVACSEVLEHIENDKKALSEISKAMKKQSTFILTVPMNPRYWGKDDSLVGHKRRYTREEVRQKIEDARLCIDSETVVSGPIERLSTLIITNLFLSKKPRNIPDMAVAALRTLSIAYYHLLRIESIFTPKAAASVILFVAKNQP